MRRVYDILVSFLGESKQGQYDKDTTQYQFNCPFCADNNGGIDGKYNLEISFEIGKFHCWSCNNAGPISKLIKSRCGSETVNEYFKIIDDIRESKYYNLDFFTDKKNSIDNKILKLPKTFTPINLNNCWDIQLKNYLKKRGITQDIIDLYNIGFTTWNEEDWTWRNRIIIPSYDSVGDLNYFIGRTYRENDKRNKYKNCDADKNQIILHEDKIQWDADIYLVEGAIDCIFYPNCISLMGKCLNKKMEIYNKLVEKSHANVIICLDGDTTDVERNKIYKLLNSNNNLKGKIKFIKLGTKELPWKDFGEIYECEGKGGIIKAMKNALTYSNFENEMLNYGMQKI